MKFFVRLDNIYDLNIEDYYDRIDIYWDCIIIFIITSKVCIYGTII